jgi:hypothetical protein
LMLFTYPVIHISYGSGYLTGSMKALVNLINKGKK